MNKRKIDPNKAREGAAVLILLSTMVVPFAIGLIYGAGIGWLCFGLFLLVGAYRLVQVSNKEEKEQETGTDE